LGDPRDKFAKEGLTFDDVLLVPAESAVLPNDVVTATRLTRTIALEIPLVSAAMDTVTEARLDPPKEMLREPEFIERVCEIRDVMDRLATSTRAGD